VNQAKYIGMDVHQATISVAVMDSAGKLILESLLETKAATILQFLGGLHGSLLVTFEEGTSAAWLYDLLKPHVTNVLVCDPRKNALLKDGSKSDRIDARKLAGLLRGNHLSRTSRVSTAPSCGMVGQDRRARSSPAGRATLPATGCVGTFAAGSAPRSADGEPETSCGAITTSDSLSGSDSLGVAGCAARDTASFSHQATVVGLQLASDSRLTTAANTAT
jgi:hypothetical protein